MNLQRQLEIAQRVCEAWPTYVGERVSAVEAPNSVIIFKDFRVCNVDVRERLQIPHNMFAEQFHRLPNNATALVVIEATQRCLRQIDAQLKDKIEQIVNG